MSVSVEKKLSLNDLGLTGSHQAGMLIPKRKEILDFFPFLNPEVLNPRCILHFEDNAGAVWRFHYIYYNNRICGGTRNEYRLTGMTAFLRTAKLAADDTVIFTRHDDGDYTIDYRRQNELRMSESAGRVRLKLSDTWTVIEM